MAPISRALFRTSLLGCFALFLCGIALFYEDHGRGVFPSEKRLQNADEQHPLTNPTLDNSLLFPRPEHHLLTLNLHQCTALFPTLLSSIPHSIARGNFSLKKSNPDYQGLVQARVSNNNLYILSTAPDHTPDLLSDRTSILQQLHRALITSPTPLPDTCFSLVLNDAPKNNSWVFAQENKGQSAYRTWLMPHFAFWSWARPTLGAMDDILRKIATIERGTPFSQKEDRAVWRGTPWFNPLSAPTLRQDLIKVAGGKEWADVQALSSNGTDGGGNGLPIERFCAYKYVVYTEGVTYSGRLAYHQACASVLVMAPLTYLTTTGWLVRPIYAEDLIAQVEGGKVGRTKTTEKRENWKGPKPVVESVMDYQQANAVYVAKDFSNLEATIGFLRRWPEVAERIARNQRMMSIGAGNLSPAAEVCYWRALVRGWASVVEVDADWGDEMGERFETWILKEASRDRSPRRGS
ncbi:hypothetical protein BS50DRAFT_551391 [Corynespora cassiicola Philippines]|uniref:Glycosyl transferase CAP10 domain-containing protein n=1 Tax=Corynespora cassiicola Philippines TaxID=1448308 RepID=A0A2T2NRU3_CORCC|nr:hypothetical protein BS50DRAFT_551391 [Corynespora cassiicola Philippines]